MSGISQLLQKKQNIINNKHHHHHHHQFTTGGATSALSLHSKSTWRRRGENVRSQFPIILNSLISMTDARPRTWTRYIYLLSPPQSNRIGTRKFKSTVRRIHLRFIALFPHAYTVKTDVPTSNASFLHWSHLLFFFAGVETWHLCATSGIASRWQRYSRSNTTRTLRSTLRSNTTLEHYARTLCSNTTLEHYVAEKHTRKAWTETKHHSRSSVPFHTCHVRKTDLRHTVRLVETSGKNF